MSTTDTSHFVKKTDFNKKSTEIEKKFSTDHNKSIATQEFDKLSFENFAAIKIRKFSQQN